MAQNIRLWGPGCLRKRKVRKGARAVLAPLLNTTVEAFDARQLQDTEARLLALSETISARYFLQFEKSEPGARDDFLA